MTEAEGVDEVIAENEATADRWSGGRVGSVDLTDPLRGPTLPSELGDVRSTGTGATVGGSAGRRPLARGADALSGVVDVRRFWRGRWWCTHFGDLLEGIRRGKIRNSLTCRPSSFAVGPVGSSARSGE